MNACKRGDCQIMSHAHISHASVRGGEACYQGCRPANLGNVFRGTQCVKKRDCSAKSVMVGVWSWYQCVLYGEVSCDEISRI